jgi:hypothetical protein
LQVAILGPNQIQQSYSNISKSFLVGATNTESFGSRKAGPSFVNSKSFFMFLVTNAFSIIEFSRAIIDEGIVDSPPNKEIWRTTLCFRLPFEELKEGWKL